MADYVITKVRFNSAGTHINEVLVNDEGKSPTRIEQRATVVAALKAGKKYRTQPPGSGAGASVQTVRVGTADYIRTDANSIARDNLDNLPTF